MKEKEKLLNWSISIITMPLSSMKFWLWRTLHVKEKFIGKLYISNLIPPVLRPFAFSPFRGQSIQSIKAMPVSANYILEKLFSN